MRKEYYKIFNMVYELMKKDITHEIKIRLAEEYDVISLYVALGNYVRNKYLWHHHEFCNYLAEKLDIKSVHPEDISHEIIKKIHLELESKADK